MKKRIRRIAGIYLIGAIALVIIIHFFNRREQANLAQRVASTDELLERICRVEETGTLGDELTALGSDTGLPLVVEWDALAKEKITRETPVSVACHDEPLAVILRRLLLSAQDSATPGTYIVSLGWMNRPAASVGFYVDDSGRVVVTSYSHLPITMMIYDLRDLFPVLVKDGRGADWILTYLLIGGFDFEPTAINRRTYERIGAWCCDRDTINVDYESKQVFVVTTRDGHRRFGKILQRLRNEPGLLGNLQFPSRLFM